MTIGGIILGILGAVGIFYGVSMNNDMEAQLEYLFTYGKKNPGNGWIIIGAALAVIGVLMFVLSKIKGKTSVDELKKKVKETGIKIADKSAEVPSGISESEEAKTEVSAVAGKTAASGDVKTETADKPVSRVKSRGFSVPDDLD